MKILFIHQNFPGQFKFIAPTLAAQGHTVLAMTMQQTRLAQWQGVRIVAYAAERGSSRQIHPWAADLETKVIRGEACYRAALKLKADGFSPDVIVAHPGWGESLFLKEVWPAARLGIYCEFFYRAQGADTGFDPEFPETDRDHACRLRMKNTNYLLHFDVADAGLSPTHWQASTFPETFRSRIEVVHDGIDTDLLAPDEHARFTLPNGRSLSRRDEIVTFVNRNLEPYRGYHIFMRALPQLLKARPRANILIVGGDQVSYGSKPADGGSWKDIFIDEVRPQIADCDWARVHFLGKIPYPSYVKLLQVSTVHVYLTYPFVLSWSLLEAMSAGCAIVASDTQPLREVVRHGETGRLVDFFGSKVLIDEVVRLLDDRAYAGKLGQAARQLVVERYDLKRQCLPRLLDWVDTFS